MIDEFLLSDELDRKVIEALLRIADEQSRSLMTDREARLAIRAVFESAQGLVGEEVGEAINVAMSQFNSGTKQPLFPMHLKLTSGTVLYISICLDTNQINILNTSTGEWRTPIVCESAGEALKKSAQFVRSALLKGAKKL
ncbi:hypothetical protein AB4H89_004204 [Salmonella enterica]|uniref:Uncharacterized protein n=1 Tax=Salmonella enterica TaxID=28901 RepID=A0A5T4T3Z8_SALER|nr:hypothetical protein [Salmonella enterica]EBV3720597.1 hypothetical protein [Salmonella enterica subsp. enterica serovar Oranienburg]ECF1882772.1 hypothetical protein [Salmonella enterica subsp. enterica serovar Newport]ECT3984231.1 hypothetical protein [Salmonella enterica subsp. houtenae serovar 53:z4,z23:-]EHB2286834.1 hypothetical protein [Salmonella enterica subsp. enterica serovar Panama]EKO1019480.1 hypothetical protein [Salmonella enterica subsp. enterica]